MKKKHITDSDMQLLISKTQQLIHFCDNIYNNKNMSSDIRLIACRKSDELDLKLQYLLLVKSINKQDEVERSYTELKTLIIKTISDLYNI